MKQTATSYLRFYYYIPVWYTSHSHCRHSIQAICRFFNSFNPFQFKRLNWMIDELRQTGLEWTAMEWEWTRLKLYKVKIGMELIAGTIGQKSKQSRKSKFEFPNCWFLYKYRDSFMFVITYFALLSKNWLLIQTIIQFNPSTASIMKWI